MAILRDIEQLLDGLCRSSGVLYAVREIPAFSERDLLNREVNGCLFGEELQWYSNLRSTKRQAEFFAGRLAAKTVLALSSFGKSAWSLEIVRNPYGAPKVRGYEGIGLSISHCDRFAVAVTSTFPVGVDLERNEQRPEAFLRYFLTESERAPLITLRPTERKTAVNQYWSRKEAACKVGGWGASLDFGKIDCSKSCTTIHGRAIELVSDTSEGFVASLAYELTVGEKQSRGVFRHTESARAYG